ncbi:uncharacterized protein [Gossypium hirsutum]|uniref:Uncharacterized protein LOC107886043 isoform X2 n=1 Tax=Gossypium hirsutum TaxID=3635 RepID=A0A1U8HPX8_GOSHI|nr:uncharacterized protein LOC107886043 isoform X2 [Gossypium hirsutum]XP_040964308.1 uncharacterized protein LOC107886043 isoform X2 [Gossypium hirsutum]
MMAYSYARASAMKASATPWWGPGIQESFQIFIFSPMPIFQPTPFSIKPRALQIFLQLPFPSSRPCIILALLLGRILIVFESLFDLLLLAFPKCTLPCRQFGNPQL